MSDPQANDAGKDDRVPELFDRLDRLERAVAELVEATLLIARAGPAHFEDARAHAHKAKGLVPKRPPSDRR